jgi:hypothetical protein
MNKCDRILTKEELDSVFLDLGGKKGGTRALRSHV